nr:MAG TPA: hypothetical protein [Caudoviricetes sp.]
MGALLGASIPLFLLLCNKINWLLLCLVPIIAPFQASLKVNSSPLRPIIIGTFQLSIVF